MVLISGFSREVVGALLHVTGIQHLLFDLVRYILEVFFLISNCGGQIYALPILITIFTSFLTSPAPVSALIIG